MDGHVLAQPPRDGPDPRHLRSHLRGRGDEVLRTLRGDRHRHERAGTLGRGRGLLLRQLASRRRHPSSDPGALDRRAHPTLRRDDARSRHPAPPPGFRRRGCACSSRSNRDTPPPYRSRSRTAQRESRLLAIVDPGPAAPHPRVRARRIRIPQRSRPARAFASFTPTIHSMSTSVVLSRGSITSPRNRRRGCTAATRTGVVRSGFRSTTSSSKRFACTTASSVMHGLSSIRVGLAVRRTSAWLRTTSPRVSHRSS